MRQSEPDPFSHRMLCLCFSFPQHPKTGRCHSGERAQEQEARGRQVTEGDGPRQAGDRGGQPEAVPTCRAAMSGTGLTGSRTQARLSLKVYSTVSVLMMVQHEPSFSSSRLASLGQGDACGEWSELQTHSCGDGNGAGMPGFALSVLVPASDCFVHGEMGIMIPFQRPQLHCPHQRFAMIVALV